RFSDKRKTSPDGSRTIAAMSFMRPKTPALPAAPPPPVVEDTAAKAQDYQDALRRRRGRAASILTDRTGGMAAPQTAAKALLGQ
ncbi:MAG: hypothetical protein RLZZ524_3262, partial [Pseudomonadota bacterium]